MTSTQEKVELYEQQLKQLKMQAEDGAGLGRPPSPVLIEHLLKVTKDLDTMAQAINPNETPELRFMVRRIRLLMDEMIELQIRVNELDKQRELDS